VLPMMITTKQKDS